MTQAIRNQHPAVVLRSHYMHLRMLLAIAVIAVAALSVAIVVVATDDGGAVRAQPAPQAVTPAATSPGTRFDGGPDEGTRGIVRSSDAASLAPGTRFDGGPEEGTRGAGR